MTVRNGFHQRHAGMSGYYLIFKIQKKEKIPMYMKLQSQFAFAMVLLLLILMFSENGVAQNKQSPKQQIAIQKIKDLISKKQRLTKEKSVLKRNKTSDLINKSKKTSVKDLPVELKRANGPLSRSPENNFSFEESLILEQMDQIKQSNNPEGGKKILELQKKLETLNGSTSTVQPSTNDNLIASYSSGNANNNLITRADIYTGQYIVAMTSQVEQRGSNTGRAWISIGQSGLDTGAGATGDTILMYYTDNGGDTYTKYATIAFSQANKMGFDDLDMEIIEDNSGTKYIYFVFGYYTNGYFGERKIGYIVVTAPTLSVFGSTFVFPGQTPSSEFFNARITSDNARYPSNPYVSIICMQDSTSGGNDYLLSKYVRILSPYNLNPAITYLPKSIYLSAQGFYDYSVSIDIANFHNGSDSVIFVLSNYPGFNQNIYTYKAFSNSTVYPVPSGILTPSGDNIEYARIAANGGTNQSKMLITYTDDYLNTGDYDLWALSTTDANTWNAFTLEYTSLHDSRYPDVIGRRNADGSFAVAFANYIGSLVNVTTCTFNQSFNLATYLHRTNQDYSNSIASPKPSFRYVNGDSTLNFYSYYYSLYSVAGYDASNLYVKLASEGYYDEVTNEQNTSDYIQIILAESTSPYNYIDTAGMYVEYQLLMNETVFDNAPDGDYYLVTLHRNLLETWSSVPVTVTRSYINSYDFTSASSQAYGDNMELEGSVWCLYSGDINGDGLYADGIIDANDVLKIYNDALNFVFGDLLITDLNGDNFVDAVDILMAYNHVEAIITTIKP